MRDQRHPTQWTVAGLAALILVACSGEEATHPWIDLGTDSPHRIIEYSGADAGQVVIAMDPTTSREEALALGRLIQSQAPARATVNIRLYNDEETARTWRSSAANQRVAHLLVVVSSNSATGDIEVRWVRPDSLDAPTGPSGGVAPSGLGPSGVTPSMDSVGPTSADSSPGGPL